MDADSGRKYRILIVEDDLTLADGLCRALGNSETETVCCHTLGEAAKLLEAANGQPGAGTAFGTAFDLVLLDVNLPDGNGFDYLKNIKEKYRTFVIMLTANDMETDIVAGLEAGADDYITKPFSLAVLRARVATQLRRVEVNGKDEADEGWVIDGDYRFHFARMLFYHGEEQIELSKSEQKLLHFLVKNRGITLSRDSLLDCIWSVDAEFVDENTLSVTVKRLRDKLDGQDRIKTVYGIGYRWE